MPVNEISSKAKEYKELQSFIKQLQDEADAIKASITAAMEAKGEDTIQTDLFTIRWTEYETSRLDGTALKKELPDVAARYTKTTTARRFQVA
jgi:predicted phage-related endonuclease